jgi:hypothetical protein
MQKQDPLRNPDPSWAVPKAQQQEPVDPEDDGSQATGTRDDTVPSEHWQAACPAADPSTVAPPVNVPHSGVLADETQEQFRQQIAALQSQVRHLDLQSRRGKPSAPPDLRTAPTEVALGRLKEFNPMEVAMKQIRTQEQMIQTQQRTIDQLKSDNANVRQELHQLRTEHSQALYGLKISLLDQKYKNSMLETRLESLEQRLSNMNAQHRLSQLEQQRQDTNNRLREEIVSRRARVSDIEEELDSQRDELRRMQRALNNQPYPPLVRVYYYEY